MNKVASEMIILLMYVTRAVWKLEVPGKFFIAGCSIMYEVVIKMKFFCAWSTNLKASAPWSVPL